MSRSAVRIYIHPPEVEEKLRSLGLSLQALHEVLRHISLTMSSFTEDHPSWGPGITTASEAVATLRAVLKPFGWQREEESGFSLTVNSELRIALNIAKGDEDTGLEFGSPVTVSEKGICTAKAISKNQLSLDLPTPPPAKTVSTTRPTWYLLYSKRNKAIWSELSLPIGLSPSKQISDWSERIILPNISDDSEFKLQPVETGSSTSFSLSRKNA